MGAKTIIKVAGLVLTIAGGLAECIVNAIEAKDTVKEAKQIETSKE